MSSLFDFILVRAPLDEFKARLAEITDAFGAVEVDGQTSGAYRLHPKEGIEYDASLAVAKELSRVFGSAVFGAWNDQIGVDQGYVFPGGELDCMFGFPLGPDGYPVDYADGEAHMEAVDEFAPGHELTSDDLMELFAFTVYGY